MTKIKEIKNLWGWLDEVMLHKTPPKQISEDSWDKFSPYMMHRFISMNPDYIQIANYLNQKPDLTKEQVYMVYKQVLPKRKVWSKYIKPSKGEINKELVKNVSKYFECSGKEASEYVRILGKEGSKNVLRSMGLEEKEINKLIKNLE